MTPAARPSIPALQSAAESATPGPWEASVHAVWQVDDPATMEDAAPAVADTNTTGDAAYLALLPPETVAALCAIAQAAAHLITGCTRTADTPAHITEASKPDVDALHAALSAVDFGDATSDQGQGDETSCA